VPITGFVDTSHPHNANDLIRLGEMKRFGKALFGGGKPIIQVMRIALFGIVLVGAYLVDRTAYDGRHYHQGVQTAHSFAIRFNYKIKDALSPLAR
jgi:hypothetical protein